MTLSINRKLTLLVMAAVATALALSYTAFVVNDVRIMRSSMVRQLSTLADVLGSNSMAAVTFNDNESAKQILSSLRMEPMVESACIYDAEGKVFATYSMLGATPSFPPLPALSGHEFQDGYLNVTERMFANGETVGTIYLHGSLDPIRDEIVSYAGITAAVMVLSFAAAFLLASRLQRGISGPILALAEAAERVSTEQDYSIRVRKTSNDELGVLYDQFNRMLEQVDTSKRELLAAHDELESRVVERTSQLSITNDELGVEIAERRRAEQLLEDAHRELVTAARRAGMAEIATGVLHNVGNVLNSVNVSANLVAEEMRTSKSRQLMSVAAMLEEHGDAVSDFIAQDERGKQIPALIKLIARAMVEKEQFQMKEIERLTVNIEHIKTIVSTQQSYTRAGGMIEPTDVALLLDDAVRLQSASFERHKIRIVREYVAIPPVLLDKQRLLQVVINLVKNAKEAMLANENERVLTLHSHLEDDRLIVEVSDTGVGIMKENLTRIFLHGFTTKSSGHGFGLHSSANAAAEMDGSLSATSDGPMKGATFRLNLPLARVAAMV